ncbi:MAG: right-handed parallel beta-helix repeat-containing protein, partial [Candidatus Zixiibacteriota bacterium]
MKSFVSLTAAIIALFSLSAMGTVINVPGDYAAIQDAIDASVDNDTVLVADGTYPGRINFYGKGILLLSENGPEYTTITPLVSYQPMVSFGNSEGRNSILSGFTIEGNETYWVIHIINTSPTIYNNIIKEGEVGIRLDEGGRPLIRRNEIKLCSHSFFAPKNGGGIRFQSANGAVIDSNEIHDNYADVAGAIYLFECADVTVKQNLIYSNSSVYIGGLEISACENVDVLNNTLVDNTSTSINLGSINSSNSNYVTIIGN